MFVRTKVIVVAVVVVVGIRAKHIISPLFVMSLAALNMNYYYCFSEYLVT